MIVLIIIIRMSYLNSRGYQQLLKMNKSQGISCRISKVNEQLQRLAGLIQNDHNLYSKTKQALKQFNESESSEDSFNYFEFQNQLSHSKGFNNAKIQVVSNLSDQIQSNAHGSTAKSGLLKNVQKRSRMQQDAQETDPILQNNQSKTADITVKKFRPVCNQGKKKKQSQQKIKQNSRLKNSKSENKMYFNAKADSIKKNTKKQQKQLKKVTQPYHLTSQIKGVYKKMKTTQNAKTNSQNRLNESLKMHINLKKQVTLKITDLNIQKQQCQKQAQYLKSVMKIQQQQKLSQVANCIGLSTQQSAILVFMARLVANFFSQFFHQKIVYSDQCSCEQLQQVLKRKNYLIKYMLKLPDILKKDNTLCEQRCKKLFEQKHFIDHRIQSSHKALQNDLLYIFIDCLHDYISFLINNSVVKETKRKMLPIQFNSQRSARGHNNNNNNSHSNTHTGLMNINIANKQHTQATIKQKQRQYDSDRKSDRKGKKQIIKTVNNYQTYTNMNHNNHNTSNSKPTLKRMNTHKVLSPKSKVNKISHSNNHSNIHNSNTHNTHKDK